MQSRDFLSYYATQFSTVEVDSTFYGYSNNTPFGPWTGPPAYTVSLQIHEIGIRMALGAQQRNILLLVLLNGLHVVVAGILVGLLASYALTRFLASQISGISATDPATFAAVVAIVISAGMTACLLPARRAARVDPLVALRYE